MKSYAGFPSFSVEIQREEIPVSTMYPEMVPDTAWRYVDKKGHGHFWAEGKTGKLPTLHWVVTGKRWVGDEYDGDEYEMGEWRCRLCDEVVEPKKTAKYSSGYIDGPTTFLVTIEGETFYLTPEDYWKAIQEWVKVLRATMKS